MNGMEGKMHRDLLYALLTGLIALAIGCVDASTDSAAHRTALRDLPVPAKPDSGQQNLTTLPDGRIALSWIESEGRTHFLRFSVLQPDSSWSAPSTVVQGSDWFVNWADFPSMAVVNESFWAAHWLARSGKGTYAYDVNLSLSTDAGEHWGEPLVPHRDGTQTEHGFVSLLPWRGMVSAVWLDGRNTEGGHGHGGPMTLRHALIEDDGRITDEALLDDSVCDCCQTAAAVTSDSILVAYRDRSEEEIRDISVVRFADGVWSEPYPVSRDGWRIPGCPVNGPAIAARGNLVAVAWYTQPEDVPQVRVAFSQDGGRSFSEPIRVDDGDPLGRVDCLLLDNGEALVSWLEFTGDKDSQIRVRQVAAGGDRSPSLTVARTNSSRSSGFAHMVASGDGVVLAWRQTDPDAGVRTTLFQPPGIEPAP